MKNKATLTTFLIITLIISLSLLTPLPLTQAQEEPATSGADIDSEIIKENVKKRLENVALSQDLTSYQKPIAFMGILEDRSDNTLSINTLEGIKLASASASTPAVRLPQNSNIELEEIGLGEYIMALGFINGAEVLNTKRLLVQNLPPTPPINKTFYGQTQNLDTKEMTLTLKNYHSQEQKTIYLPRTTDINLQVNGTKEEIKRDELPMNFNAIVIYTPSDQSKNETDTALEVLLRAPLSGNSNTAATQSATLSE